MTIRGQFITFEGGEGCGKSTQVKLLSAVLTERNIAHIVTREPGGTPLAERIRPLLVEPDMGGQQGQLDESQQTLQGQLEGGQQTDPAMSPLSGRPLESQETLQGQLEGGQQADPAMNPLSGSPLESQETLQGQLYNEEWTPLAETLLFFAARVQHVKRLIEPALAQGKWVICDRFADSTFVYQGIAKGLGVEYLQKLQQLILGEFTPDKTILLDISPEIGLKRAGSRGDGEDRFEKLDISFHQKLRAGFLQLAKDERFTTIDATQKIDIIHSQIAEALL